MELFFLMAAVALALTLALHSLQTKHLVIQGCSDPLEPLSDNFSAYFTR